MLPFGGQQSLYFLSPRPPQITECSRRPAPSVLTGIPRAPLSLLGLRCLRLRGSRPFLLLTPQCPLPLLIPSVVSRCRVWGLFLLMGWAEGPGGRLEGQPSPFSNPFMAASRPHLSPAQRGNVWACHSLIQPPTDLTGVAECLYAPCPGFGTGSI